MSDVAIVWDAVVACDARVATTTYAVQRSTTGPSSGFSNIVTGLTVTNYTDTGRSFGVAYWYRIVATIEYVATDLVTNNNPTHITITATSASVLVTIGVLGVRALAVAFGYPGVVFIPGPVTLVEQWGAISA